MKPQVKAIIYVPGGACDVCRRRPLFCAAALCQNPVCLAAEDWAVCGKTARLPYVMQLFHKDKEQ